MKRQTVFRETIFALSSGALPSGVAIVRVSGAGASQAAEALIGAVPPTRRATLCIIRAPGGAIIDRGLVLYFQGPDSFTGEDCVEFHLHGGKAVVAAVMTALAELPNTRQAEAGEFTRRAFINGKMDLTEAEGLADLIAAETEAQRRLAITNAEGAQQRLYASWRKRLLHARAMLEAELDFSDEGDVPGSVSDQVWEDLHRLDGEIVEHEAGYASTQIIRDGFKVVLLGRPNAGKSSLLNALAQRDVAIVTDIAGTTRDLIETILVLAGIKVVLTDTAGIRPEGGEIERIGMDRALAAASNADLILELVAPGDVPLERENRSTPQLVLATKADLGTEPVHVYDYLISSATGAGLPELLGEIGARASDAVGTARVLPSRLRHMALLSEGRIHLRQSLATAEMPLELRAEELRLASNALGRIVGDIGTEDVLGEIFSEFCIGK